MHLNTRTLAQDAPEPNSTPNTLQRSKNWHMSF